MLSFDSLCLQSRVKESLSSEGEPDKAPVNVGRYEDSIACVPWRDADWMIASFRLERRSVCKFLMFNIFVYLNDDG